MSEGDDQRGLSGGQRVPGRVAGRVLGLDVGSRTIGVAVTDELGVCAHALKTLARKGTQADVLQVAQIAKTYETKNLVIGIPYDLEGNEGQRAKRVRVFADALLAAGFAIEIEDERYSTVEAERHMLKADLSRARRKELIDSQAAQVILTSWLARREAEAAEAEVTSRSEV